MKKIHSLVLLSGFLLLSLGVLAQAPPPTPPSDATNGGTNGVVGGTGGGAPVGNGTFILFALAAAYGIKKYKMPSPEPKSEE